MSCHLNNFTLPLGNFIRTLPDPTEPMSAAGEASSGGGDPSSAEPSALIVAVSASVVTVVVMFGIACSVRVDTLRDALTHQRHAFAIGLLSQLVVMPALAHGVARALQLPPTLALTLVVLGCSPGGTSSNVLAYWAKADIALSIALTAVTNTLAFGTMPLLLWIWARGSATTIPFGDVALALGVVVLPAMGVRPALPCVPESRDS